MNDWFAFQTALDLIFLRAALDDKHVPASRISMGLIPRNLLRGRLFWRIILTLFYAVLLKFGVSYSMFVLELYLLKTSLAHLAT